MADPHATPDRAADETCRGCGRSLNGCVCGLWDIPIAPATAWCSCPDETPNEVACVQRYPDGSETCGVCGGLVRWPGVA
jgi:hypothetical protein